MDQKQVNQVETTVEQQLQFEASPFLFPETLERYEAIQKGFAERAIKMAEKEQSHRQSLEKKELDANIEFNRFVLSNEHKAKRFGQNATFAIATLGLICGTLLLLFDKPVASLAPFLAALAPLAAQSLSSFWRKNDSSKEIEKQ